jgi:hypothetical protein
VHHLQEVLVYMLGQEDRQIMGYLILVWLQVVVDLGFLMGLVLVGRGHAAKLL